MAEITPYNQRLEAAIERSQLSKRQVGAELATRENLGGPEAGRRQLYKYLDTKHPAEPEPERAAILAVILRAPELALVQPPTERRQARRAELEARVEQLEAALEELGPTLSDLASLPERVRSLEQQAQPRTRRGGR